MSFPESIKSSVIALLGLGLGAAAAVSVVGYSSEEHAVLSSQLERYGELSPEQQKILKASFAEFSIQTDERRQELVAMHETVRKDPELKDGLEKYFFWWSSLSQSEWDSFPEMDRAQQIAFVKSRINKPTETEKIIVVDFGSFGQTSLQPLHLTVEECVKIITDSLKETAIPEEISDELGLLKSAEHRALELSLWIFQHYRQQPDQKALAVQSEKLRESVLANISDMAWKRQFEQIVKENANKVFLPFWLHRNLLVILDQSTMALGNRLMKEFPVSDAEIVKAFVSLEDKSRHHALMTMPSAEARTRLEFLAQSSREQTPEQKLLVKFIAFARERQRVIGALTFGLGSRGTQGRDANTPPHRRDNE
ncbi:MAG TPA: hypothetical protein PLY87_19370 [Planctomycetaceae bacterium]|nr:hypothetical protein [Planctomycetaceae bacterium]